MTSKNPNPTADEVLDIFAAIINAGRRAADVIQEQSGSDAAARAFTALQAARAKLETGTAQ